MAVSEARRQPAGIWLREHPKTLPIKKSRQEATSRGESGARIPSNDRVPIDSGAEIIRRDSRVSQERPRSRRKDGICSRWFPSVPSIMQRATQWREVGPRSAAERSSPVGGPAAAPSKPALRPASKVCIPPYSPSNPPGWPPLILDLPRKLGEYYFPESCVVLSCS